MGETSNNTTPRPPLWTNPITLMGLLLVALGLVLLSTFWLFVLLSPAVEQNQYLGVLGFMILPGVLINGLVLCPIGIVWRKYRLKKSLGVWRISSRSALIFLSLTFFLILPALGVAGYRGYQFTESAEFCGTVCHNMDPQYKRYEQSPHAHVECAGCHIGPGASPFVKAKISGLRQVYKVAVNTYPRPIPPAIVSLRPAADTCEACHWPSQFMGSKLKRIAHYAPDENNTRHEYDILIKVGGTNNYLGKAEGIHAHMLGRIEYIADDERLENIPWVKYKYDDGRTVVFRSDGKSPSAAPPEGKSRKLDCIDCHNYAGHEFLSPERAVNHELSVGRLDITLPYIKREAVRVLAQPYKTKKDGFEAISRDLESFYRTNYPSLWNSRPDAVEKAIQTVQNVYDTEFYPEMHVDWRTYPSHVGHMESAGCFRCHDGLHIAEDGRRISSDCNTCHTFLYRKDGDPKSGEIMERTFDHPSKINDLWTGLGPHEKMLCTDCHDGGLGVIGWDPKGENYKCGTCHPSGKWLDIQKTLRIRQAAATQPVALITP
jgi:nitrate/TMAO reductase-like tetraheme cytochrome c subunit